MKENLSSPSTGEPLVSDYGEGRTSRWGLDEGDMSLIDQMLRMTPVERLRAATFFARSAEILRSARRI